MKRYRRPKTEEGQIVFKRGKCDGEIDMCIFYGDKVPRCDRALVMNTFSFERLTWDKKIQPAFFEELERRGYDLDTLIFSIKKKKSEISERAE